MRKAQLVREIKNVIKEHYGWELWNYQPKANSYDESIMPFIEDIIRTLKQNGIDYRRIRYTKTTSDS